MDFNSAKKAFITLVNSLDIDDRCRFLAWCKDHSDNNFSKQYFELRTIAEDIKTLLPLSAIFPSEKINHGHIVEESEDRKTPVLHVDSFLFEDEHIDAFVEEGKLSRNYCKDCGSSNVAPITFISHSASIQSMEFIFQYMLPDLRDKVLLDVGSRLGAVLYGAYYCSAAKKIIGVEINKDMCDLQKHIVTKYNLGDRIQVICDDIRNIPTVIDFADVIILNNVFECFMSKEEQEKTWKWLRKAITKSGTLLITAPSLEDTLQSLNTGINTSDWLERVRLTDPEAILKMEDQDLLSEICLYSVI